MLRGHPGCAEHGTNAATSHGRDAIHANSIHPTHGGTHHSVAWSDRYPNC